VPDSNRTLRLFGASYVALLVVGAVGLVVSVVVGLRLGSASIDTAATIDALLGRGDPVTTQIVVQLRLPRVLGAALVGGALAIVGATLQAVMKNPLAEPYILGISSGASVGAASSVLLGFALGGIGTSMLAFVGAVVSVVVVYRVAVVDGRVPPVRLILAGVALSSFAQAVTSFLLYLVPEATAVRGVIFWLLGGLSGADWAGLTLLAAVVGPATVVLLAGARWQTLLLLGDDSALALGLDAARARQWLIAWAALATGALVAFAGAIGFVGLIVPHALRPFTGPDHRRLLVAAALYGGWLLVVMDGIARSVLAPEELPVGILTGLLGAPFFLLLLKRASGDLR
jgi:iron complex transport system permease protein